jgi:hypothetical protein
MADEDRTTALALLNKETGKLERIGQDSALAALRSGKYQALKGAAYSLRSQDGSTHSVAAETLQGALAQGWGVEERGKAHEFAASQRYAGKTGLAAALGAAQGGAGAFGWSADADLIERSRYLNDFRQKVDPYAGTYVEGAADRMRSGIHGLEQENAGANMAGKVGGFMVAAGASGGGIAGAGGNLFKALGMGAAGAGIAGMALEGALISRADAYSEAALENRALSGQELASAMGLGAILGGGMGAGFEGAGMAWRGLKGMVRNPFVARELESMVSAEARGALRAGEEAAAGVKVADGTGFTEADRAIRQSVANQESVFKKAAADLYDSFKEAYVVGKEDAAKSYGDAKRGAVRRIMGEQSTKPVQEASREFFSSVREPFEGIVAEYEMAREELNLAKGELRKARGLEAKEEARRAVDLARSRVEAANDPMLKESRELLELLNFKESNLRGSSDADVLIGLNDIKKDLRTYGVTAQNRSYSAGSPVEKRLLQESADALFGFAKQAADTAENESLFGLAGTAEREINAARNAQQNAEETLLKAAGRKIKANGAKEFAVDPKKIESLLRKSVDPRSIEGQALQKWVKSTTEFHEAIAKHYGEDSVAFRKIKARGESVGAAVDAMRQNAADVETLRAAGGGNAAPSSLIDKAVAMATPGGRADMLAHVERAVMGVDKAIGTKLQDAFVSGGKGQRAVTPSPFLGGTGGVRGAAERSMASVLNATDESIAKAVQAAVEPSVGSDILKAGGHITEVVAELTQTVIRGVTYLRDALPPGAIPDPALAAPHLDKPSYSDSELLEWTRKATVVDNPLILLEHLGRGRVVPGEVEAVKAVYPDLYAKIETQILQRVASTPQMSRSLRLQLSVGFGIPLDAATLPGRMKVIQMPPAGRAGKLKTVDLGSAISKNAFSDAERMARR